MGFASLAVSTIMGTVYFYKNLPHPSLTSYLIPRTYLFSHTQYPPPVLPKEHTDHEPGYEPGSSLCYNNNVL